MAEEKIDAGWLTNYDGQKFAPKTFFNEILTNTGMPLYNLGTANQVLTTDGAGGIDWKTINLDSIEGILSIDKGGTGVTTHTLNAILLGNNADTFKEISTANGAFYATEDSAEPQFGILPIGQGGTGTVLSNTPNAILCFNGTEDNFTTVSTKQGALYATAQNGVSRFGLLPESCGGTAVSRISDTAVITEENGVTGEHGSALYYYGTEDIVAGTTKLETGKLYFVYE